MGFPPNYPGNVPGHEIVGEVSYVGKNAAKKFAVGEKVGVGYLTDSCRSCTSCVEDEEENYCAGACYVIGKNFAGQQCPRSGGYGGYTSQLTVRQDYVVKIPQGYPLEKAAPILCAGITMWGPLIEQVSQNNNIALCTEYVCVMTLPSGWCIDSVCRVF
jgi:D-arabinose 1-dehydrogenase-like Zn-dependent alcohol dehydrogenase